MTTVSKLVEEAKARLEAQEPAITVQKQLQACRKIIKDTQEERVEFEDSNQTEYHFRKDYIYGGDQQHDYSLSLMYLKRSM